MRLKTVLFLVNGFGVEQKNSYSIYNKELMPNFDKLMKGYMFSTITSNVNNIYDGYRNISLDVNEIYNYSLFAQSIENDKLLQSGNLINLKKQLDKGVGKLHIFCLIDNSEEIVDNLKYVLKYLNPDKDKKIYYHLVLTSNNVEDYDKILKILSKINIELNEYGQIGFVMGLGTISNDNQVVEMNYFYRMFISEIGEKWQSFKQKIDVCYGIKLPPNQVKPFIVNTGFILEQDDIYMFWNYDRIDLTNFIELTKGIKYGEENNRIAYNSLFEIKAKEKIPYLLNLQVSKISLASNIQNLKAKTLIVTRKDSINIINYYCNGLQSISNPLINFIEFDNYLYKPKELINIINNYDHDLIIINYDINDKNIKTIEELKECLHNIDIMLGYVYDNFSKQNYTLIVSSLYGVNKLYINDKGTLCSVNFSSKVPFIYIDKNITQKNYLIAPGDINAIVRTCYKTINKNYSGDVLFNKKNILYRLLFK